MTSTSTALRRMLWILPVLLAAGLFGLSACSWSRPDDLGLVEGRLRPCPDSPNCVCSQDETEQARIEPIAFEGPATAAFTKLRDVVDALPRTEIISEEPPGYLHVEFTSFLMRFVDDVEFLLDADGGVIHVRSASRVGHSDLGANRARVERIREAFDGSSS